MKFALLIPGKFRSDPCIALLADYAERCRRNGVPFETITVKAEGDGRPKREALEREAQAMLARVPQGFRVVAIEERGRLFDSPGLAKHIGRWRDEGPSGVAFLVGSARGLGESARQRADLSLSLSKMTFPHELAAALLSEQLYRALAILAGHPYHKD